MEKIYTAIGLMSGTSMDGVDASIIKSDGNNEYSTILDKYFEYDKDLQQKLINIKDQILSENDLKNLFDEIKYIEKAITLFHVFVVNEILKITNENIDLVGFHGQTILHKSDKKISKQLGDGNLLSQLTKKIVVYNFRQKDIKNGGEGAPLTPIFHKVLSKKNKIDLPTAFLNIGGIANITLIKKNNEISSMDIGPGNCLIDKWIRIKTKNSFDKDGSLSRSGKVDKLILDQSLDTFYNNKISKNRTYDVNDFNLDFVRGLSIENGAATLTEFTAEILSKKILNNNIYICGGGRKNKFLLERIENKIQKKITLIDKLGINGDFVESNAFAYLAIRSYLDLPISFPNTTGCKKPCSGGIIVKNY